MLSGPVLLYDGDCDYCSSWVERLQRRDPTGRIRCVPAARRGAVAGLPEISAEDLDRAVHLVVPGGRVYTGARAISRSLAYLPGWRAGAVVLELPGISWLLGRIYSRVARRRHRLGCATGESGAGQRR